MWQIVLGISCFILFYSYLGYGILVYLLNRLKKKAILPGSPSFLPSVSMIIAAYNEEDFIEKKILNCLQLDYPAELIEFIIVTDGSNDRTMEIVQSYPLIRLLHQPERAGKSAAMNRAVALTNQDVLVFSDANTLLNINAIRLLCRHYQDPKVGGVTGEKKVIEVSVGTEKVGTGEGLYWKYESALKKLDSEFYSVVGAAGELFSVRKQLYEFLPDKIILDDFVTSMRVTEKGYRFIYEPEACAMELPSSSLKDEQKRKIRIAAGGFQAMQLFGSLLLFWRQPKLSFLYISHRVLRWTLCPICLILAFLSNALLLSRQLLSVYNILFLMQLAFYGLAVLAVIAPRGIRDAKLVRLSYYFVFMNTSVIQGFFRFLSGNQPATWEKAGRLNFETSRPTQKIN